MSINIKFIFILFLSCVLFTSTVSAYELSTNFNGVITYEDDGSFAERGTIIDLVDMNGNPRNTGFVGVDGKYEFVGEGNLGEYMVFYVNGIQVTDAFPMETGGMKTTNINITRESNVIILHIDDEIENNENISQIEPEITIEPTPTVGATPTATIREENIDDFDVFNPTGVNVDTIFGIPSTIIIITSTIIIAIIGYGLYLYADKKIYREEEIVTIDNKTK